MKRHRSGTVRRYLARAAWVVMAAGCSSRTSPAPGAAETRRAALYSSDPATVTPGAPSQRTATCPGKTLPDQCGGWAGVELDASVGRVPSQDSADQRCLCRPIAFQVPASIPVTKGNAGAGETLLSFRKGGTQLQTCLYHGNELIGRSGQATGGDAYALVNCTDRSKAGSTETADWFSLLVLGGDSSKGPTAVSLRLGAPDVVNGVVQEEILYATDSRIPGAALHIPRGSAPPNQAFSISVLPQPAIATTIANGSDPFMTMGYAVDIHATGVDNFVFTDVPGAACPRIDLPYSPTALATLGPGGETRLRARQITALAGLKSGASVLAPTSEVTIDPVNHIASFCVSHLSFYVMGAHMMDATLTGATLAASPASPCATAADCDVGEACNGSCYVDLLASAAPPLLPNSPYVLHLDFKNNSTTTWSASPTMTSPAVTLSPVSPAFPPKPLTTSSWSSSLPVSLGADVAGGSSVSFDVPVIAPATEDAAPPNYGDLLDLCLTNGSAPFGECFSWDPPSDSNPSGTTPAPLKEICDGLDNDENGETDDLNGNVATEPGKPCDNGQSGSCYRTGTYQCAGLFATTCNAPTPAPNACGGCASLAQAPGTSCDTGQTGPCPPPGIVQCNGADDVVCVPQTSAPAACPDAGVDAADANAADASVDAGADASTDAGPTGHLIAVYDDSDPDYSNGPFTDTLSVYQYDPTATSFALRASRAQFNTTQTIGGSRQVAASADGRRIAVIEVASGALTVFDENLAQVLSLFASDPSGGPVAVKLTAADEYVLFGSTIYDGDLRVFDASGNELPGSPSTALRGFDVAVDEARGTVWSVASTLMRGDAVALTGNVITSYGWSAVSVDVVPADGSVWVAERIYTTGGVIHHYDAAGVEILADQHPWPSSPFCVRVNPRTGDVWVASSDGISRIDPSGTVNVVDDSGAQWWSAAVDPSSGIVWVIGGNGNPVMNAYAADGHLLSTATGFSTSQKWVAFVR
jgi:hypothetical protein